MTKNIFYENHLEELTLEYFLELGYEVVFDNETEPGAKNAQRDSYKDVILRQRLYNALKQINHKIPKKYIEDAIRQILINTSPNLVLNNKIFQKMITDGVDVYVEQKNGGYKTEKVYVFDFINPLNNNFMVASQFTVEESFVKEKPSIVVFVNGIPLVVIELKGAINEDTNISDAYNQIQIYKDAISSIFMYNSFIIVSDGVNAKVGTLTSTEDRFMVWKTVDGKTINNSVISQLEVLIKGMLQKDRFLDIINHFILFQDDGQNILKILAGYHQYHAVKKAMHSTEIAISEKGDKKIGVIWHTQGSGKSLSMIFYAGKIVISKALENPTIVIITDRNDLDDQLYATFLKSKDLLRCTPVQANSRAHLKELLNNKVSGGIIFTTIHKFAPESKNEKTKILTNRKNIIVIADEAHRSQYGLKAQVVKDDIEADIKYGYATHMRDSLPNASYIAFTGTPIEVAGRSTKAVFGNYIDIYDMSQAVADGTTVKIYYESRIAKLGLQEDMKEKLDLEYEEITEYQEYTQKEALKSKWARLEVIIGDKKRIEKIAKDIVNHFEKREELQEGNFGKGMIIAMSRRIALHLYKEIIKLRPHWHSDQITKGKIKVVMTGSTSDPEKWQKYIGTKGTREILARRIKDKDDELKLVIVRDMWLTGFDVPSMHTMYIDKPMVGHTLMQAIARVNRVFKNKQGGLIVDYIGIAENLKEALSQYAEGNTKITGLNTEEAFKLVLEKQALIKDLLHGKDYNKFFEETPKEKLNTIMEITDHIIGMGEEKKKQYIKLVAEMSHAYALCATADVAQNFNIEVGFHKSIKANLVKEVGAYDKDEITTQLDIQLNQLISRAISSNEIIDILDSAGLSKPSIAVLSDEFLEEIKGIQHKNLAIELLHRILKGNINNFAKKNLVQSKKFSQLLENCIRKYQNRTIETTEVILELIELAKDINNVKKRDEITGLTEDELAFYDALSQNGSACEIMGHEVLKQIARDLTVAIKKDITVDWYIRESVQAKIRMTIKKLLRKYGYPPDVEKEAVEIVMEQTSLTCKSYAD